jgi:YHS domain-containing protein
VLWLEDGGFKMVAGMGTDPVCGMLVEANGPSWEQAGKTYWFCSEGCRREYAENLERFDLEPGHALNDVPE